MTTSKMIRLLNEYVEKGLGEQVVLRIEDAWDFDPDLYPRKYKVREELSVLDAIGQYEEKKGYICESMSFKELCKNIEGNQPVTIRGEYQDTKDAFFAKHPDFAKTQRKRLMELAGFVNRYKNQFVGI